MGHNDVAAAALNTGNNELHRGANEAFGIAGSHLAAGAECGLAEHFDMVAALAGLDDAAVNRHAAFLGLLNGSHACAAHGAGEHDFVGIGTGNVGFDRVANSEIDGAIAVHPVLAVHDAVDFGADVHKDAVISQIDDLACHFLAYLGTNLGVLLLAGLKHCGKILFFRLLGGEVFFITHCDLSP